jgi:hypothetical protein
MSGIPLGTREEVDSFIINRSSLIIIILSPPRLVQASYQLPTTKLNFVSAAYRCFSSQNRNSSCDFV